MFDGITGELTILGIVLIIRVIVYLIQIIALWKIFKKTGTAGWKSLIPFYNDYVLFRQVSTNKNMADMYLLMAFIGEFVGYYTLDRSQATGQASTMLLSVSLIVMVAFGVLTIIKSVKEAKAFGKSNVFAIGILLLTPLFNLILGFGSSKYLGPQD